MKGDISVQLYMTDKQYELFQLAMAIMKDFYNAEFDSLCDRISQQYDTDPAAVAEAKSYMADLKRQGVVVPVASAVDSAARFLTACKQAKKISLESPEQGKATWYTHIVDIADSDRKNMCEILDNYSRILMGQFIIIFEYLDIPLEKDKYDIYYHYRREGGPILTARNLLFPSMNGHHYGWHSNLGISNDDTCADSKLAYEMYKALCCYGDRRMSQYILRLSSEPLMMISSVDEKYC